jgi:hypothetical protein
MPPLVLVLVLQEAVQPVRVRQVPAQQPVLLPQVQACLP